MNLVPEDIAIVGAGGFGRETLDVIEAINTAAGNLTWRVLGVVDDDPSWASRERLAARGVPYLGRVSDHRATLAGASYVVAIGAPAVRRRLVDLIDQWGARAATLVHPSATIGSQVTIEPGTVVCSGVQVSTNVRLRKHVHLNPGAIIGHDTVIENYVSVNPGSVISGDVTLREGVLVGAGAVVLQKLVVGIDAVVGASACVTRDVADRATVTGVPARARSEV